MGKYHPMIRSAGAIGVTLIALLAVACGGGKTEPTPVPGGAFAKVETGAKQELIANLGAEPGTLDPQLASALHEFSVIRQVFQGMLGFSADLGLMPVVATEVPTAANGGITPDGMTYTFKLRDDATWSDGRKVTAADFVYAIKRLLDPTAAARYSFLFAAIRGAGEYATAFGADEPTRNALRAAVAVDAPDQLTLRITLERPDPTFLHKMALPQSYPVREDVVARHGARWTEAGNYVGNGPYTMAEWVHQDHITLERNARYWGHSPRLDRIVLKMISDPNSELSAYRNNELHFARVPPGTERSILADPVLGRQVVRSRDLFTFGLFFNLAARPLDNVKVRQAIATGISREAWIEQVNNGVGMPATSWLPPGIPGFDIDLGSEYRFSRERARELLSDAGFPGGRGFPKLTLTFVAEGDQRLIAEFLQAQLKDNLGVEIELLPLDPPAYFQQVLGGRQFELTGVGWGADYPDPENFLAPLFITGSPNNIGGYSNPEFDQRAVSALQELDQEKRLALWKGAHESLVRDAPVAPLFYQERFFLKKPSVQGLTLTGIDGFIPGDTRLTEIFISR